MSPRKSGTIFLIQIIVSFGASLLLSLGGSLFQWPDLPIVWNSILSQLLLIVPALIVFLYSRDSLKDVVMIRDVHFPTVFLLVLALFLLEPLMIACNAFSMTVAKNEVVELGPEVVNQPFWLMFFLIGVFGPACEEFTFRGLLYGGFRKSGRIVPAILLQGFLFGLMHGNLNQFCYATVIGIALGVVYEATGSIFATIWIHVLINAPQVVLLYALKDVTLGQMGSTQTNLPMMLTVGIVFLGIAMFTMTAFAFLMYGISSIEERKGIWKEMLCVKGPISVWSIPCVIGCVLAAVKIVMNLILDLGV